MGDAAATFAAIKKLFHQPKNPQHTRNEAQTHTHTHGTLGETNVELISQNHSKKVREREECWGKGKQINCHKVQLVVATCNMRKSSTNFDCREKKREKEQSESGGKRERWRERGTASQRNGVNYENANLSVKFCVKGKSCNRVTLLARKVEITAETQTDTQAHTHLQTGTHTNRDVHTHTYRGKRHTHPHRAAS